ncbi:hypothetical protein Anas_01162 [Armadillidium nasatum]|uniref:Uncharacterized protein n=1 Tax=Armadillidium nasatum TaxID=96803 RepID=A0A5N5SUF8_9CRUS|nr:hypothetical protein Anas_01162 [Armadillidium nasatum]
MPMKIRGGTGAPARIFAQLPSAEEDSTSLPTDAAITEVISDVTSSIPTDDTSIVSSSSTTTATTSTTTSFPDEIGN